MDYPKEMNPRIVAWLKKKSVPYDLEYVKADPLPKTPIFMQEFLGMFNSFEDFSQFAKSFLDESLENDEQAVNNALWTSEFLLADLGMPVKFMVDMVRKFPDFFSRSYTIVRDAVALFPELFYIGREDLHDYFLRFPDLLYLTKEQILNQVVALCDLLQVSRLTIFDLVHKYPQILLKDPKGIKTFIVKVAKLFKEHQEHLRNAIFNDPSILEIPVEEIEDKYNKVYAKGFTRLELRRMFIKHYYNFKIPAEKIIKTVDRFAELFSVSQKEAKTIVGECPFVLPYDLPESHFDTEMRYRLSRKYMKTWQSEFLFPHKDFVIKFVFARVLGLEMQLSKILNTDIHRLFGRYFYLRKTLGDGVNFSRDLWTQDYQFEDKYDVPGIMPAFAHKLTMQEIDDLFDDYNNKLQDYILYHYPIERPTDFVIPPLLFPHDLLDPAFVAPKDNLGQAKASFPLLGFTGLEVQFLLRTMPKNKVITAKNIADIYEVFRLYQFTLFDTNWIILHNPAILDYHPEALKNRLYTISCHHIVKFFCRAFPERI